MRSVENKRLNIKFFKNKRTGVSYKIIGTAILDGGEYLIYKNWNREEFHLAPLKGFIYGLRDNAYVALIYNGKLRELEVDWRSVVNGNLL